MFKRIEGVSNRIQGLFGRLRRLPSYLKIGLIVAVIVIVAIVIFLVLPMIRPPYVQP